MLNSGKVTAFDGTLASNGVAGDIVKIFSTAKKQRQVDAMPKTIASRCRSREVRTRSSRAQARTDTPAST